MLTLLDIAKERDDTKVLTHTRLWLRDREREIHDLKAADYAFSMSNMSRTAADTQFSAVPSHEQAIWVEMSYESCWDNSWD
jgi:hypothetical protein